MATARPGPSSSVLCWADWAPIYPGLLPTQLSHSERQYLAHFSSHVLDILPTDLTPIHPYIHGAETVLYAAMATSAANLARLHGKHMSTTAFNISSIAWVPEPSHKINAFLFAGKALSLATRDDNVDPAIVISAQVLLSLVEAELGTFEGFRSYLGCLRSFVSQTQKKLPGSQDGLKNRELVRAVMHYQSLQGTRLTGYLNGRVSSETYRTWRQPGGSTISASSSVFQALGWEAFALGNRLGLLEAMRHSTIHSNRLRDRNIRQLLCLLAPEESWLREMRPEDIAQQIEQIRLELDRLSATFSRCQVPADLLHFTDVTGIQMPPFATHEEAMNAADFMFCKITCHKDLMASMSLPSGSPDMPDMTPIHAWVATLLQIASGINMNVCTIRNVYRPGILQILTACLYPCRGGTSVLNFLEAFYEQDSAQLYGHENVSFPSTVAIPALRILRSQWEMGRTVLIMQSLDGGVNPSSTINTVAEWTSCSVHGLEANGDFFDEVFRDL